MFAINENDEGWVGPWIGYLCRLGHSIYTTPFLNTDIIMFETEEKAKEWLSSTYMPLLQSSDSIRAKTKQTIIKLDENECKIIFKLKLKGK